MPTLSKKLIPVILLALLVCSQATAGENAIPEMLKTYQSLGAGPFSAQSGEKLWKKVVTSDEGDKRECATCHKADLTKNGEHKKNGKTIKPMAPSVNAERYTEVKKIKKWFRRNCKWTWGRVCTPQEKGDLLTYLGQQ